MTQRHTKSSRKKSIRHSDKIKRHTDDYYMRKAIALSTKNIESTDGGPFGAIIVRDGKIISYGTNKVVTKNDPTAHAEIEAIRSASKKLKSFNLQDCTIYTSCEPCPMCLSAIYWSKIEKIFYSNTRKDAANINFSDDYIYRELKNKIQDRKIKMTQLLRNEALKAFEKWERKKDKITY